MKSRTNNSISILMVIAQCNPKWASVPLLGYQFFTHINALKEVNVTLVTHARNKPYLQSSASEKDEIIYIQETKFLSLYYKFIVDKLSSFRGKRIWPLYHILNIPVTHYFQKQVYRQFNKRVRLKEFDLVHALTPILPRYAYPIAKSCKETPFVLGPVNGGLNFPKGFSSVGFSEFSYLNFMRNFSRFLPKVKSTYTKAALVLAGSYHTKNYLKQTFNLPKNRLIYFPENGIPSDFFYKKIIDTTQPILHLLFLGRLVPYKCPALLIEAIAGLPVSIREHIKCNIVGNGSEFDSCVTAVTRLGLESQINMCGWIDYLEVKKYLKKADLFVFPSIREFGGAVIMEAMAHSLPCITIDHGGIGEYVEDNITGFKIQPKSPEYVVQQIQNKVQQLFVDRAKLKKMSEQSYLQSKKWEWPNKANQLMGYYRSVCKDFM